MVTVYSPLRSVLHMNSKDLSIWILPSFFVNVASITYQNGKSSLVGLADVVEKYVHKGDKLYLEGKIRTRSYSDQSGAMRYITEIYVDNMEMLSPKGANPGAGASASGQPTTGQQQQSVAGQPQQAQQSQAQPAQDNPADDLPF